MAETARQRGTLSDVDPNARTGRHVSMHRRSKLNWRSAWLIENVGRGLDERSQGENIGEVAGERRPGSRHGMKELTASTRGRCRADGGTGHQACVMEGARRPSGKASTEETKRIAREGLDHRVFGSCCSSVGEEEKEMTRRKEY
jgi:hypothetical protein